MNLSQIQNKKGFTLSETTIAMGIASFMLLALLTASIALQKSLNAVDRYFATQMQQIRIIEYLSRDVKRSYVVTSTSSPQTVTCTIPNYLNGNARRDPTVTWSTKGVTVDYVATPATVVYSVSNQSILRTENGALTTIASSTDNLLPAWLDVELSNTQYLTTNITFLPIFTSGGATASRTGTTLFSTAYLRNLRKQSPPQ
jgi:type II secretory pathway pseudopilin PulG